MARLIQRDRSVIPACDVSLERFEDVVRETANISGIGAYKIGFMLGLNHGLPKIVEIARRYTNKPLIYDHQKAGTDIPDMGAKFSHLLKTSGIDAAILFPQSGPVTEYEWIKALQDDGLGVLVGGEMTHPRYLYTDVSNGKDDNYYEIFSKLGLANPNGWGGFIDDLAPRRIYLLAVQMSVTNFVVPGNKPESVRSYRDLLGDYRRSLKEQVDFYALGFIAQGGEITETGKSAGKRWHAIVGRGITQAKDIAKTTEELTFNLDKVTTSIEAIR